MKKIKMEYSISSSAFEKNSRTIETEKPIEILMAESINGLIPLKDGCFIGVDLLRNALIKPIPEVTDISGLSMFR